MCKPIRIHTIMHATPTTYMLVTLIATLLLYTPAHR